MTKSLSESAAEILRASVASAAKDPTTKLPGAEEDLGGATETQPDGGDVGKKAASNVKQAAKPGKEGTPAEPAKKVAAEETETSEEEEVVTETTDEVVEEEEINEEEISEEEILEIKKNMMKDMIAKHKGSVEEDVDALFNGESLSEEFRTKATTIFEAAVQSRVEKIVEDIVDDNDNMIVEAVEEIKIELSEKIDEYLNYVVEQWMEKNEVAVEAGLRAELTEDFINGLKNLFAEHYIEIPDEKVDVAEELAVRVVDLEEQIEAAAQEKATLAEELNIAKRHEAIRKICEGLTEVQISKMKSLAEGVEFTTEGEFNNKLAVLRENYFPANKLKSEVTVAEETSEPQPEVAEIPSYMSHYVSAISKTLPK